MKYKDLAVGAKFYLGSFRPPFDNIYNDLVWTKVTESGKAVLVPCFLRMKFDSCESYRCNRDRANHGWNAYFKSNIHQFLNSDKEDWYTPSHEFDQVDYSDSKTRGFLTCFSEKERSFLVPFQVTQHTPMGSIKLFGRQVTETVLAALPAESEFNQDAQYREEGDYIPALCSTGVFMGWTRTPGGGVNKAKYRGDYSDYGSDLFCNDTRTVCPMIMISDKMPISDTYDNNGVRYANVQSSGVLSNKIMEKYLIL